MEINPIEYAKMKDEITALRGSLKDHNQMYEHQNKIITMRINDIKKLRADIKQMSIVLQAHKDKIEELLNEVDSFKETA